MIIQPLILAAGQGKRMGNPDTPKVLTEALGRPLIAYIIDALEQAGLPKPAMVVGFQAEKVKAAFGPNFTYVLQEQLLGTGHAVLQAEKALAGKSDAVLITFGDQPLCVAHTFERLVEHHQETGATISMLTITSDDPVFYNFARILRNEDGSFRESKEYKDCSEEELTINEYNPAVYLINDAWLWPHLHQIGNTNAQSEYYLPDILPMALAEGCAVELVPADPTEAYGVNTPEQLQEVERILRSRG